MVIETKELERIKSEVGDTVERSKAYGWNYIIICYYPRDPITGQVDYNKKLWSERLPKKDWNKEDKERVAKTLKIRRLCLGQ